MYLIGAIKCAWGPRSQEKPGGTRRSQEEPEGTRKSQE